MKQHGINEGSALPVLPGIDIPLGLSHVGNNQPFYFQLLERFRASQRSAISEFQRECQENLQQEARRRVHSLRGVAANIGALDIQKTAGDLEMYLKNNGSYDLRHPDLQRHLKALEAALKQTLDGLDKHHEATKVVPLDSDKQQAAQSALQELRTMLQEDRADAVYFFDNARTSLATVFDDATLTRVASLIRQFDFLSALRLLRVD